MLWAVGGWRGRVVGPDGHLEMNDGVSEAYMWMGAKMMRDL